MLININTDIYTSKRFLDDTPHLKFPLSSELWPSCKVSLSQTNKLSSFHLSLSLSILYLSIHQSREVLKLRTVHSYALW